MLFAVEGGGFFSSSASGYRKGLTLILLVPVVDQETDPDNQLASNKNRLVRASLVCFGCATTGLDCSLPLKVIPTQHQEVLPKVSLPDKDKDQTYSLDLVVEENIIKKVTIKSCLRKSKNKKILVSCGSNEEHEVSLEKDNDSGWQTETTQTRKVQWTDTHGGELVEIREFEPELVHHLCVLGIGVHCDFHGLRDDGGSDAGNDGTETACACTIM
ncbi:hypothetical protein LIER_24829 [Lithospermum erythrorhizon]|uniref:Uncharacterized protein n=1 Tax=Lithospermum erythrorhizon TaxID=34254 RepID=A0AAV3R2Q0_LITER